MPKKTASFNSLFEMQRMSKRLSVMNLLKTFNSLFEMLVATDTCLSSAAATAFNSLFEMPDCIGRGAPGGVGGSAFQFSI